jgi:hypothetical protein
VRERYDKVEEQKKKEKGEIKGEVKDIFLCGKEKERHHFVRRLAGFTISSL